MKAKTIEELRNKFFEECVSENTGGYKVINYAPNDLFEWIKENIIQPEPLISEPKQVTEGMIDGSVLIHRLNDSSFEDLLKYLNVNYEIVKKEPFCDTEFKISIQDLDSAIWIGRRFQMKLQGDENQSLQNKEEL